jgi:hypothetical protein
MRCAPSMMAPAKRAPIAVASSSDAEIRFAPDRSAPSRSRPSNLAEGSLALRKLEPFREPGISKRRLPLVLRMITFPSAAAQRPRARLPTGSRQPRRDSRARQRAERPTLWASPPGRLQRVVGRPQQWLAFDEESWRPLAHEETPGHNKCDKLESIEEPNPFGVDRIDREGDQDCDDEDERE